MMKARRGDIVRTGPGIKGTVEYVPGDVILPEEFVGDAITEPVTLVQGHTVQGFSTIHGEQPYFIRRHDNTTGCWEPYWLVRTLTVLKRPTQERLFREATP